MFLRYNLLGILWAVFILIICILPPSDLPVDLPFEHFDKVVHFSLFTLLALLLIVGFKKQYEYRQLKKHSVTYTFFISMAYGFVIEMLQQFIFTTRYFDAMDIISNFSGTIFGILIFFIIYGKS